ncbi:MAG: EAL domain-containing protein [Pseudobutyrivibrio sp.]|nr:EAL domain-containing protein [Pseudobutyrivibrio sp.]
MEDTHTLYEYQYIVASMIVTGSLLVIFMMLRSYMGKSNILFVATMICNFLAALFDTFSCFAISNSHSVPLWLNYLFLLGYLLFYNMMSVLYFLYIDHKAKLEHMERPVRIAAIAMIIFYLVSILTSPWTHFIVYFDEAGVYHHGSLIGILWTLPFLVFMWELVIFYQARDKFSSYQFISTIGIVVSTALSVTISIVTPNVLVGELLMSVAILYVYICFENPANYTYLDTQCLNDIAFMGVIKHARRRRRKFKLTCFYLVDYSSTGKKLKFDNYTRLNKRIADSLHKAFKRRVFCLGNGKFVVLSTDKLKTAADEAVIKQIIDGGFEVDDKEFRFEMVLHTFYDLDEGRTVSDISAVVNYVLSHPGEERSTDQLLEIVRNENVQEKGILEAIRRAINEDGFQVFYQPIYSPGAGRFKSAEALVRLIDKDLGFINPETMIVIAEKNNLINQVGDIIFEKVCKFISENKLTDLGVDYIEVNLSPLQCRRSGLVQIYTDLMRKYNVSPYQLNFEITETAQLTDEKRTMQSIVDLFVQGIAFSIDDYGSGFASAEYLIKMPVSLVKIDKTILWSAMNSTQAMIVLKNTIAMVKELGKSIVVEGVETEEMASVLLEYGVDYNQGFLYSKPIPSDEYIKFLKENNKV